MMRLKIYMTASNVAPPKYYRKIRKTIKGIVKKINEH